MILNLLIYKKMLVVYLEDIIITLNLKIQY